MTRRSFRLVRIAITAALYIALSLAIAPLTFGLIQIRFAELLVILCLYNKDYCYALVLGCLITNIFSPLGIIDVVFGTCGTLLSVIAIRFLKRTYLAWIPPTICTFLVALEFMLVASEPFWLSFGTIALGEFIAVGLIGTPLFMILERKPKFLEIIGADKRFYDIRRNIEERKIERNKRLESRREQSIQVLEDTKNIDNI